MNPVSGKIKSGGQVRELCRELKAAGKKVVFTNGCFDLLHPGHVLYLEAARLQGDFLVVGLNSDASIKRLKGDLRPVMPEADRAIVLAGLQAVDCVVIFEQDTPYELISVIVPDILVKGGDWALADIVGKDIVEEAGGKVMAIPYIDSKSTTGIINKILERHQK